MPVETVIAVNAALGRNEAVAACRLRSGDTLVTFASEAIMYKDTEGWIIAAFGAFATRARRELTVIARHLPAGPLRAAHIQPATLLADIKKFNNPDISNIYPHIPQQAAYTTFLVGYNTLDAI